MAYIMSQMGQHNSSLAANDIAGPGWEARERSGGNGRSLRDRGIAACGSRTVHGTHERACDVRVCSCERMRVRVVKFRKLCGVWMCARACVLALLTL